MKVASTVVLVSFFLTISAVVAVRVVWPPALNPDVQAAQDTARIANLRFYTTFWQIAWIATGIVALITVLLVAVSVSRSQVKRASVHLYKVGASEIVVHERDLALAWPVVLGLVNAEKLEKLHGGLEQALALYGTMADIQTRQIRALVGQRGHQIAPAAMLPDAAGTLPALPGQAIPTFAELLQRGDIAPGSPVIFGFHKTTGQPESGPLHDLYSTILIGLSGFGKTTCLAYLIGASMLAEQARFTVLDRHYPAPESLGAALGALVRHRGVTLVSNPFLVEEPLTAVEQTLDARLASGNTAFPPLVLVVDEHERWATHVARLVALELRIINEGRKVKVYLFLTSKSANADKIGDSALRDNMVTSYVFKTKPHNARTFFKDREKAALLGQVTDVGEAIFTNRKDESCVVKLPLATPEDMQIVAERLPEACATSDPPAARRPEPEIPELAEVVEGTPDRLTPEVLTQQRQRLGLSLQDIVDRSALKNKMQLSRFEHGSPTLSDEEQRQVLHTLFPSNGTAHTL